MLGSAVLVVLSHLSEQAANQPTKPPTKRQKTRKARTNQQKTENHTNTHNTRPDATETKQQTKRHNGSENSKGGQRTKRTRGGGNRRRPTGKREKAPGKAAGTGGRKQHGPRSVKNVNPSTPLVYPNRRFHKITTPDANTYCGCDSAVTYFSAMSNKGTCSTPTPKCTSDSFFSLQTPHTTEQVNKNQGRHTATAHKQRKEARSSSVATVSSALGDTAVQFSSEHLTPLPWADVSTGKLDSRFPIHNLPSKVVKTIPNCFDIQIT